MPRLPSGIAWWFGCSLVPKLSVSVPLPGRPCERLSPCGMGRPLHPPPFTISFRPWLIQVRWILWAVCLLQRKSSTSFICSSGLRKKLLPMPNGLKLRASKACAPCSEVLSLMKPLRLGLFLMRRFKSAFTYDGGNGLIFGRTLVGSILHCSIRSSRLLFHKLVSCRRSLWKRLLLSLNNFRLRPRV